MSFGQSKKMKQNFFVRSTFSRQVFQRTDGESSRLVNSRKMSKFSKFFSVRKKNEFRFFSFVFSANFSVRKIRLMKIIWQHLKLNLEKNSFQTDEVRENLFFSTFDQSFSFSFSGLFTERFQRFLFDHFGLSNFRRLSKTRNSIRIRRRKSFLSLLVNDRRNQFNLRLFDKFPRFSGQQFFSRIILIGSSIHLGDNRRDFSLHFR